MILSISHSVREEVIGVWEGSEFVILACVILSHVVRICSCREAGFFVIEMYGRNLIYQVVLESTLILQWLDIMFDASY